MSTGPQTTGSPIQLTGPVNEAQSSILTPDALALVAALSQRFEARRQDLLARRVERQKEIDNGKLPDGCLRLAYRIRILQQLPVSGNQFSKPPWH